MNEPPPGVLMTPRSGLLVLLLSAGMATTSAAQVPSIQVFSDPNLVDPLIRCGPKGQLEELFVVLRNVDFEISAVDFTIDVPF